MGIDEPEDIEVVSMEPYEYIHYKSSNGRIFMDLCYESGFAIYSAIIELTPAEIRRLNSSTSQFISEIRVSFSSNREYFEQRRDIKEFKNWPVVKNAINKWHGR